jgi:hypothetical protein
MKKKVWATVFLVMGMFLLTSCNSIKMSKAELKESFFKIENAYYETKFDTEDKSDKQLLKSVNKRIKIVDDQVDKLNHNKTNEKLTNYIIDYGNSTSKILTQLIDILKNKRTDISSKELNKAENLEEKISSTYFKGQRDDSYDVVNSLLDDSDSGNSSSSSDETSDDSNSLSTSDTETSSSSISTTDDSDTITMLNQSLQPIIDDAGGEITSIKPMNDNGKLSDWDKVIIYVPTAYSGMTPEQKQSFADQYGPRIEKTIIGIAFPDQVNSDVAPITVSFRFENSQEFAISKTLSPGQYKVK